MVSTRQRRGYYSFRGAPAAGSTLWGDEISAVAVAWAKFNRGETINKSDSFVHISVKVNDHNYGRTAFMDASAAVHLPEPGNTYVSGIHHFGAAAEGSSTTNIFCSYAEGEPINELTDKEQPLCSSKCLNSTEAKGQTILAKFQALGRHSGCSNANIIARLKGHGAINTKEELADVTVSNCNYLDMASFQAFCDSADANTNADANTIVHTDGNGYGGEKLVAADKDGSGNGFGGEKQGKLPTFQAFRARCESENANADADANIIVGTDGNGFGGENGDSLSMASFQALGAHGCYYANAYPYASAVQRVWRDNCAEVFRRVVDKFRQPRRRLYIALDLEFVADASTNVRFRPVCWNTWYDHLRTFVNGGDILQVGLALAFEHFDHHHHGGPRAPSPPVIALEINLELDVDAREYNGESIAFLAHQGHGLARHRDHGVTPEQFLDGLLRHLPLGVDDSSVTWVTYHGDMDFAFLLRLLQQGPGGRSALPQNRAAFMRQVRRQFPVFYDVRVLGQLVKEGFAGKLTALAENLGVQRTGGEHHAGSDALLTLSCFWEILRLSEVRHELHRLDTRQSLLSGIEELDMGIRCARHIDDASVITVEVRGDNFHKEAWRIDELVPSNFKTIGVHVQFPQLGWGIRFYAAGLQQDYDLMKSSLKGIDEFQVTVGFMNAEGMLAYGRVWKFHLKTSGNLADAFLQENNLAAAGGSNKTYVHPGRLAWLLASCRATHNPNVAWVTYQGSQGIACLIKSFLAGDDLPGDWCSYINHKRGFFPHLYDVGLIAQRYPDIGLQSLEMLLGPQALLALRCYKRLAEIPYFPHIAEAVQGKLMGSHRSFWY